MLLRIQSLINNTESLSTIKTLNKVAFSFTPNRLLDLLASSIKVNHKIAQVEVKSVISFAQVNFKHHYDHSYQPMNLKINNFALLCLHKRYSISLTLAITKKLTQQYVSFFRVLEKIKKLAYQLNILADQRVHNIFTIAQLKPAPNPTSNSFNRPRPDQSESVYVESDTEHYKSFEIK